MSILETEMEMLRKSMLKNEALVKDFRNSQEKDISDQIEKI